MAGGLTDGREGSGIDESGGLVNTSEGLVNKRAGFANRSEGSIGIRSCTLCVFDVFHVFGIYYPLLTCGFGVLCVCVVGFESYVVVVCLSPIQGNHRRSVGRQPEQQTTAG